MTSQDLVPAVEEDDDGFNRSLESLNSFLLGGVFGEGGVFVLANAVTQS